MGTNENTSGPNLTIILTCTPLGKNYGYSSAYEALLYNANGDDGALMRPEYVGVRLGRSS